MGMTAGATFTCIKSSWRVFSQHSGTCLSTSLSPSVYIYYFDSTLSMVHWDDPDLEAKLGILSVQLLYAILGLYSMEYIHSSYVEVALFRRQLPFRWPLVCILEEVVDAD
ncbi:hypothetical protein BDR07DRAFT_367360 [Suillus spraguei]|nr:hypothetical protein BDR07DRAFT_367360 [Suillus spraguei]